MAATPIRALAAEEALTGRPWTREVVAAAAEELARAGTPMSDHRASEAYRIAMLRNSLLKFYAETNGGPVMSKGYGPLADRPDQPVVGLAVSHESADLHVTGAALYTQDLVGRTPARCTPGRSRPRTRTPGSPACAPRPPTTCPAWCGC